MWVEFYAIPKELRLWFSDLELTKSNISSKLIPVLWSIWISSWDIYLPNPWNHTDNVYVMPTFSEWPWESTLISNGICFHQILEPTKQYSDGLLFTAPNIESIEWRWIFMSPADCAIIWLSHKDNDIWYMWLVHSGRRWTAKDILGKTLTLTKDLFGEKALSDINVQIAPFAKWCCYEFSKDTFVDAFLGWKIPEINRIESMIEPFSKKYRNISCMDYLVPCWDWFKFDHEWILRAVLKANWVSEDNIYLSHMCTICEGHDQWFYSSRIDSTKRFWVLILNRWEK